MCYHVSTKVSRALKNDHKDGFRVAEESERSGAYERPSLPATFSAAQGEFIPLRWGLIPAWARDRDHAMRLQKCGKNARVETMFGMDMFWYSARNSRCLLWIDGFYEWQHADGKSIQHFIHMPDRVLFPVCGLASIWRSPVTHTYVQTAAIVTSASNALLTEIHNHGKNKHRMPLILSQQDQEVWLDKSRSQQEILSIGKPYPDGILVAEEVEEMKAQVEVVVVSEQPNIGLFHPLALVA